MLRRRGVLLFILLLAAKIQAGGSVPDSACYISKFIWDKVDTILTTDFSHVIKPESPESFSPLFHFPPVRQDTTGTCWAFSGTSFLESENYRVHGNKIKLSEMYAVYWEYVEKIRRFVKQKGNSHFGQGSQERALLLRMKQYGAVPAEDYTGLTGGRTKHDHGELFRELRAYLDFVQTNNIWDETLVIAQARIILDKYLGVPPETIRYKKRELTPVEFMQQVVKLPLEEYVSLMSFIKFPFYTQAEYEVEDNWWHDDAYYNVPLEDWYQAIINAVQNGYTVGIGGDVSEPGKGRWDDVCIIPSFDIPPEMIDQNARELRFYNQTTTDDHGIHLVGYRKIGDWDWFLIKDSGSSAYAGQFPGYYFYRGDFIRLKMLTIIVHPDAVRELLSKCQMEKDSNEP